MADVVSRYPRDDEWETWYATHPETGVEVSTEVHKVTDETAGDYETIGQANRPVKAGQYLIPAGPGRYHVMTERELVDSGFAARDRSSLARNEAPAEPPVDGEGEGSGKVPAKRR